MKRNQSSYLGALLVLCVGLATAGGPWAQGSKTPQAPDDTTGKSDDRSARIPQTLCFLHGPNGKGDGPVVAALKKKPADLTQITKGHAGKFPEDWVQNYIDGTDMIPAHGT